MQKEEMILLAAGGLVLVNALSKNTAASSLGSALGSSIGATAGSVIASIPTSYVQSVVSVGEAAGVSFADWILPLIAPFGYSQGLGWTKIGNTLKFW